MTWTYSGDPTSSTLDEARFLLGDTTEAGSLFSDEEIGYALGKSGDKPMSAAISLARAASAKYARSVDKNVGDLSISGSQLSTRFRELERDLTRQLVASGGLRPFSGGISSAQKRTEVENTDRVAPDFTRGQFDNNQA
jgi:hypothetical protein